jgi:hypothetical protein
MVSFKNEAIKLSAIGGTIVVATGDDGVAAQSNLCNTNSGSGLSPWAVSRA